MTPTSATAALHADLGLTLGTLRLDIALVVEAARTVAVIGPNGAGKTTLLRALAGLLPLERGAVTIAGEVLEDVAAGVRLAPEARPVAVVFQDHRLFPTMSVLENVAFGLRARGTGKGEARRRAAGWLERVGLDGLGPARPATLSGGQAQRVALARALATEPALLLLDEPLAAVDVAAREDLRRVLRAALDDYSGAAVVVTHDPIEAAALADGVVVIEDGTVTQAGVVADVVAAPRSPWVAAMLGVNLLEGSVTGDRFTTATGFVLATAAADPLVGAEPLVGGGGRDAWAVIAPQAVALHRREPETSARNRWSTVATRVEPSGRRVRVTLGPPVPLVVEVTAGAAADLALDEGVAVWASVKATEIAVHRR